MLTLNEDLEELTKYRNIIAHYKNQEYEYCDNIIKKYIKTIDQSIKEMEMNTVEVSSNLLATFTLGTACKVVAEGAKLLSLNMSPTVKGATTRLTGTISEKYQTLR